MSHGQPDDEALKQSGRPSQTAMDAKGLRRDSDSSNSAGRV